MTRTEVADEIESAINREKETRGGVILDTTTAKAALKIIGEIRGTEAQWIVEAHHEVLCSCCGHYGKAGMNFCGYCGARITTIKLRGDENVSGMW